MGFAVYSDIITSASQHDRWPQNVVITTMTASNYEVARPAPRNRHERRLMAALGGRVAMLKRAERILGEMPAYETYEHHRWCARFWELFEYEVPPCSRQSARRGARRGHMPAGRARRLRACSRRWSAIRA